MKKVLKVLAIILGVALVVNGVFCFTMMLLGSASVFVGVVQSLWGVAGIVLLWRVLRSKKKVVSKKAIQ